MARFLDLQVTPADAFSLDIGSAPIRPGRDNLCVRAYERLHPANRTHFKIRLGFPSGKGLGASAAAIVGGLVAANAMHELGCSTAELFMLAREIEGHPDNVAASLMGGWVICAAEQPESHLPTRFRMPAQLRAIIVQPDDDLPTMTARKVLPELVRHEDAVLNLSNACQLVAALQSSNLELLRRSLEDRLHQPHRARLYPRSFALLREVTAFGALGATISGAGPSVLVWAAADSADGVARRLRAHCQSWATVDVMEFCNEGVSALRLPPGRSSA